MLDPIRLRLRSDKALSIDAHQHVERLLPNLVCVLDTERSDKLEPNDKSCMSETPPTYDRFFLIEKELPKITWCKIDIYPGDLEIDNAFVRKDNELPVCRKLDIEAVLLYISSFSLDPIETEDPRRTAFRIESKLLIFMCNATESTFERRISDLMDIIDAQYAAVVTDIHPSEDLDTPITEIQEDKRAKARRDRIEERVELSNTDVDFAMLIRPRTEIDDAIENLSITDSRYTEPIA
jgi:hypothetical protein